MLEKWLTRKVTWWNHGIRNQGAAGETEKQNEISLLYEDIKLLKGKYEEEVEIFNRPVVREETGNDMSIAIATRIRTTEMKSNADHKKIITRTPNHHYIYPYQIIPSI